MSAMQASGQWKKQKQGQNYHGTQSGMGNNKLNKATWVTSNLGYSGHTSLFLICATITVLHTYTCINRCFFVQITKYRKMLVLSVWIEQTLMSLRGFREQSKHSKGFHSDKKVKNTQTDQLNRKQNTDVFSRF